MSPRVYNLQLPNTRKEIETPAPLLLTRYGQLPNLPIPLQNLSTSSNPLLLQLPLTDWHTLNPNANINTTNLLSSLSTIPLGKPNAATYTAQTTSTLILSTRAASSTDFVTRNPGKTMSIRSRTASHRMTITSKDILSLHKTLRTHLVASISDTTPWNGTPSKNNLRKHETRSIQLLEDFITVAKETDTMKHVLASISGGADKDIRKRLAEHASRIAGDCAGYIIAGLYCGESPTERWNVLDTVIKALPYEGIRILSGGNGAPSEVLSAVANGIDIVEANWPFEMANEALVIDLENGGHINVRDRRLLTCSQPLMEGCKCWVCHGGPGSLGNGFSKSYVRHLFEVHEMMAVSLVAAHNLWQYLQWWERLRSAVRSNNFDRFVKDFDRQQEKQRVNGGETKIFSKGG